MFKKLTVALVTLALMVGLTLPAYADVNLSGSLAFRLNDYNLTTAPGFAKADLEGRLWLTLRGKVNDFITYRADVYIGYTDLAWWKTTFYKNSVYGMLTLDRAFITADLKSQGIPIVIEAGALSISTYSPLAIYGDSFNIGGASGVNIISSALFPGLTTFLLLSPDVATTADNQKAIALGANLDASWGRVTGIVWTRDDATSTGYRISGRWDVVPKVLSIYALYGQRAGDTEAKYQVIGINLPGVQAETGWNPYLEYDVYNKLLGFSASTTIAPNTSLSLLVRQALVGSDKNILFSPTISFGF
ncbi:MAG: hypothetical protein N2380_06270 [bacterium]|nr:hypothetical protein [bacterium]